MALTRNELYADLLPKLDQALNGVPYDALLSLDARHCAYQEWYAANHAPFEVFLLDCNINHLRFTQNGKVYR